jgi:pilus assembly protein CpaF
MSILKRLQGNDTPTQPGPAGTDPLHNPGLQPRRVSAPVSSGAQDTYQDLKTRVQNKLLSNLDPTMDVSKILEVRHTIQEMFEQILN